MGTLIGWAMGCGAGGAVLAVDSAGVQAEADSGADTGGGDSAAGDTAPEDTDADLGLCINEWMPENDAAAFDERGLAGDWIEIGNPGDAPVELGGWSMSDAWDEPGKSVLPAGLRVEARGFLLLWADGEPEAGPTHLAFSLAAAGGALALFNAAGDGARVSYGAMPGDFSIARKPDCCAGSECFSHEFRGTPGSTNTPVEPVTEEPVPQGSTWRYWDRGSEPATDWFQPSYDDRGWPSGPAPLGYGDAHQVTVVSYGTDADNKYPTTYFRLEFEASGVSQATAASIHLLRDDGARVFLNGREIARDNLPAGDLAYTTPASTSTGGASETAYWEWSFDPAELVEGRNVLAAEVHQFDANSSDVGFDLRLQFTRPGDPP